MTKRTNRDPDNQIFERRDLKVIAQVWEIITSRAEYNDFIAEDDMELLREQVTEFALAVKNAFTNPNDEQKES